jgi:hypothetical protein
MPQPRHEIRHLFERVTSSFSACALDDYRETFHLPCLVASDRGVQVLADAAAFDAMFVPLMADLRSRGFARSAVLHQHIALLGAATAMASILWARYRGDDEELERLGATYTLVRQDGGWRIAAIVAHAPEHVLAIDRN